MDARYRELCLWVAQQLGQDKVELSVVSGDASFRRYFRYSIGETSWVVMDAPPEKEDSSSFVAIAKHWLEHGIQVPEIKALSLDKGFMLLSDFGEKLLLSSLNPEQVNVQQGKHYYTKAMKSLIQIQKLQQVAPALPNYDSSLLQQEMSLFKDWLLENKLGIKLSSSEGHALNDCLTFLEKRALAQDQVCVHRDYHARNLMICEDDSLGIIDFQDAVLGPITYDLVSLLRDCYIVWPDELVNEWCLEFYGLLKQHDLLMKDPNLSFENFKEDFDLMGLQRHLKVAGIFARLSIRDGKHAYLADIPTTLRYILNVSRALVGSGQSDYSVLQFLIDLIEQKVLPLAISPEFLET